MRNLPTISASEMKVEGYEKTTDMSTTMKSIYLSYDLGLKGDYNGLYSWLDSLNAKECGSGLALIVKEFGHHDKQRIGEDIKAAIAVNVKLSPNDRIYMITRSDDGKLSGKFLFGGRKRAPWEGYGVSRGETEDNF